MTIASLAAVTLPCSLANAQGQAAEAEYVTKVYNVADLLDAPAMLSSDPHSGHPAENGGVGFGGGLGGGMGGGMGGMGVGGMGGGMGGGGMFSVPDNVLPQFGGMGGGGIGGGGMGFASGGFHARPGEGVTQMALAEILYSHLSDEKTKWIDQDGDGGSLTSIASMLIVTHTPDVHVRVEQLLEALRAGKKTSPTVLVDVRLLEVAADQPVTDATLDPKVVEQLAADQSAARLSLRCDNHRMATVSSGLRRSYVVSLTPIVGDNVAEPMTHYEGRGAAYQPVTHSALLGLFGNIKPEIAEDQKTGRIHLGIELASGPEEVISTTFGTGQSIDRMEIESARLETSVAAAADAWTLAGSVAMCDPTSGITSGEALSHIVVLVRWQAVK